MTSEPPQSPSPKPQLPSKFAAELRKKYAKQQQRKIPTGLLPAPSLNIPLDLYASFVAHLKSSQRILALFGAGLSAASGVPTFQGTGRFWRDHDVTELATPAAFARDPSFAWHFYHWRRQAALRAKPNRAHVAFAKLAGKKPGFLAITQNIDDLSQRAGHPSQNLQPLHGSLFDLKCTHETCTYTSTHNTTSPLVPSLAPSSATDLDISNPSTPLPPIPLNDLPRCPQCTSLLRPGIVWFGEPLSLDGINRIHAWLDEGRVDLMLVVGTSASVWPAANYIHAAREAGARVATFNIDEGVDDGDGNPAMRRREEDWFFEGDASLTVPEVLKEVVGGLRDGDGEVEVEVGTDGEGGGLVDLVGKMGI